jgi:DNA-binding SARP family transcriptional activator
VTDQVKIDILGSFRIERNGSRVVLPGGRIRALLASLVLASDEPVDSDVLLERLWPSQAPQLARISLHTYVSRLRALLGNEVIKAVRDSGYFLQIAPESVDLYRFRALVTRAQATTDPATESDMLQMALSLWSGRPFGDLSTRWLDHQVIPQLTEEWFSATQRRIELDLRAGLAATLISELTALANRYPGREKIWVHLITALRNANQRADGLQAYQQMSLILRDEYGLDPNEELQQLQAEMLQEGAPASTSTSVDNGRSLGDTTEHQPSLSSSRNVTSARQLPMALTGVVGRDAELSAMDTVLERSSAGLITIDGAPGVGKTTLAVLWAHRAAGEYPDGQLFLDLKGFGPTAPIPAIVVAQTLLRGLGVSDRRIPARLPEQSAALAEALAGRKMLLLLDNARDVGHISPLLSQLIDSCVIVTSRSSLTGLVSDNILHITLDRLSANSSSVMLENAIGEALMTAEPQAARQLIDLCDRLPLALAVAAERAQRTMQLAEVVRDLKDETQRLEVLDTREGDPNTNLRASLSWSYHALKPRAAAMFRGLGSIPYREIAVTAAAAAVGQTPADARRALDDLAVAHLVRQCAPDRYEVPELVRLYAVDMASHTPLKAEADRPSPYRCPCRRTDPAVQKTIANVSATHG